MNYKEAVKILDKAITDERFLVTIAGKNYQDLVQAITQLLEKNEWLRTELKITRRFAKKRVRIDIKNQKGGNSE